MQRDDESDHVTIYLKAILFFLYKFHCVTKFNLFWLTAGVSLKYQFVIRLDGVVLSVAIRLDDRLWTNIVERMCGENLVIWIAEDKRLFRRAEVLRDRQTA